ncbi:Heavy metal-associated isoprenylated plant protein 32-like protein [Drosera capensis]
MLVLAREVSIQEEDIGQVFCSDMITTIGAINHSRSHNHASTILKICEEEGTKDGTPTPRSGHHCHIQISDTNLDPNQTQARTNEFGVCPKMILYCMSLKQRVQHRESREGDSAGEMSKQEFIKTQSCVLRVNIQCDCDGCRNKVKKLLLKVDGVYTVSIDSKQGKVTVTANVDPAVLIRKLEKSGKRAELWTRKNNQFNLSNKFKNTQLDSAAIKGGHKESNKSQKSVAKNNHQATNAHVQQILQQMRGAKEQKSVKFNMPTNHNGQTCDDDFDVEDDDDDEDYDEEDEDGYDDDSDEEDEDDHNLNDLFGHSQYANTKTIQTMGNNGHKNKGNGNKGQQEGKHKKSGSSGGGGKGKKGGGFHLPAIIKSITLNTGCKKINVAKRGGGADNAKKGNHSHGGGGTKGGGEAKNGNGGGCAGGGNNKTGGANSGKNGQKNGNGKKKNGGGANGEGIHDMNVLPQNVKGNGNMGLAGQMGQVGPLGQVGNYPMGPFQQGPQAARAMNGKYYNQGMGPSPFGNNNPYANQQYMAMLMNQQRMMMNAEAMQQRTAMYGRPTMPRGVGYVPPPPAYDPLTHMFSDENTESCSIM